MTIFWKRHALPPTYNLIVSWRPTWLEAFLTQETPVITQTPRSNSAYSPGCAYSPSNQAWHIPTGDRIIFYNALYTNKEGRQDSSFYFQVAVKINTLINASARQPIIYVGSAGLMDLFIIYLNTADGKVYFRYTKSSIYPPQRYTYTKVLYETSAALLDHFCTITIYFDGGSFTWNAQDGTSGSDWAAMPWFLSMATSTFPCGIGSNGTWKSDILVKHAIVSFDYETTYTWFEMPFKGTDPILPTTGNFYEFYLDEEGVITGVGPVVNRDFSFTIDPNLGTGLYFRNNALYAANISNSFNMFSLVVAIDFNISIDESRWLPITDPATSRIPWYFTFPDTGQNMLCAFVNNNGSITISLEGAVTASGSVDHVNGRYRFVTNADGRCTLYKDGRLISEGEAFDVDTGSESWMEFPLPSIMGGVGDYGCPESWFYLKFSVRRTQPS